MNSSILKLVRKDLAIMKVPAILWWICGLVAISFIAFGGPAMLNFAAILFVSGMAGAGIHATIRTVVEERREQTLPFIMSLPITIADYNSAKLIANLAIFGAVWLTLSAATFYLVAFRQALPLGNIPFLTIVLVAIFLANTIILATSLITETIGGCIAAIIGANIGTQMILWWVHSLEGIRSTVSGSVAVWNNTVLVVLIVEIAVILALVSLTYILQARKKDFI